MIVITKMIMDLESHKKIKIHVQIKRRGTWRKFENNKKYQLQQQSIWHSIKFINKLGVSGVATLTLGLWPSQGLAKVRAKSEARKSHFMLLEV